MTELTDERLAELRTIAEGAESQELWRTDDDEGRMVFAASGHQVYSAQCGSNNGDAEPGDAAHIAAFDPPTVLALLSDVERLREGRDEPSETVTRLTRERDEWEANEQKVAGERDELQRRLDAVLKLHANPELIAVHEGYGAEYRCNECRNHHWPCPTAKAARGARGEA